MAKSNKETNLGNRQIFSENFAYYLEQSGDRKIDVAKKIHVSASTITDWVQGRTYPQMDKIEALAKHWGISMSDLVEKRSLDNASFLKKETQALAEEFANDPESYELYQEIKKLFPRQKEIVLTLIKSLGEESKR